MPIRRWSALSTFVAPSNPSRALIERLARTRRPALSNVRIASHVFATRYAAIDQINASNFNTLKVAWEWRGEVPPGVRRGRMRHARRRMNSQNR